MRLPLLALIALSLSACDGGGDPVQQALRDAAAQRQAATVQDGAVSGPSETAAAAPPSAFATDMIARDEAAIAAARAALRESDDAEVRRMAQAVIDTRTREIADLRAGGRAAAPAGT